MLIQGRVQGLGVRPAVAKLALRLGLNGSVRNTLEGVAIHLEGSASEIDRFQAMLPEELPPLAQFQFRSIDDTQLSGCQDFRVDTDRDLLGAPAVDVPADCAMCQECLHELTDRADRRFGYAFSSCTNCGPRYSILRSMPYERTDTSMAAFHLCSLCDAEYRNSADRRFHAQTVVCRDCGPQLWFESAASSSPCTDGEAIAAAADVVRSGGILALKGLGGYQLICDATHEDAVRRLRERKRRRSKPLAVMIRSCDCVSRPLSSLELSALLSPANPIVILNDATLNSPALNVNSGMNSLGVMLPTTPLHVLLLDELKTPLVVTSGNQDAEPLSYDETTAGTQLDRIADGWLHHDRKIERPIDDSVVRIIAGEVATIRSARGIAPLRLGIQTQHSIVAVGGDQKVALAVSNGRQAILGPHIGEMSGLAARQRFVEQVIALQKLYHVKPTVIAHDLHPDYFTTRWAGEQGLRTIGIQHHHAHVVSGMLQPGLMNQQVLGIAFDGTGYGTDGTIWGGEFLLASRSEFQRIGSLLKFVLPGGEAAIREPWRIAVSLLASAYPEMTAEQIAEMWNFDHRTGLHFTPESSTAKLSQQPATARIRLVQQLVQSGVGPLTSSMGRLFDGVAALVLGIAESGHEGEPAMRLEAISEENSDEHPERYLPDPLIFDDALIRIDWRPIVRDVVVQIHAGRSRAGIAMQFHAWIAKTAGMVVQQFPKYPVVLSGGCFQNRILTELVVKEMQQQSRTVATPGTIPCNDGGLAAGQLVIAAAMLDAESDSENLSCA